ncbi:hypothetical protein [Nocardia arthritidis]|uniref:CBM6 domain-containing protein n=1 Tax=Nocardia arthritidis TaxID=228602 RepID=A0A6G9YBY5_9NOCA|nr:hypothetical protein [Nocardia arthritidis]QIS10523.1 hypothetical protein F5544_13170 [Nocardia arthritidis]
MLEVFRCATRGAAALATAGYLCAAAAVAGGASPADNLVADPDFANGLGRWSAHIYNATTDSVDGRTAARTGDNGYVGQDVGVVTGGRYIFSVLVWADPSGGSVLAIALDGPNGIPYVSQQVGSSTPTVVSGTFTATSPTLYVACQSTGGAGGWCTDFSVVPATGPATNTGSASSGSAH